MSNMEIIIYFATMILTWILGQLSKKYQFININLIPIQNIVIGVIVCVVNWIFTKDFNLALVTSGLMAGGTYDIIHNINKIKEGNKEWEETIEEGIGE